MLTWSFSIFWMNMHHQELDNNASSLINVGSCGLHVIHNSFKSGAKASKWNIEEILSSLQWLLVDSPTRKEDFTEILSKREVFMAQRHIHDHIRSIGGTKHCWKSTKGYLIQPTLLDISTSRISNSNKKPKGRPLNFASAKLILRQWRNWRRRKNAFLVKLQLFT